MEKKTPLYDRHVALGGKLVPFAGWLLPVQYPAGIIQEHMAVRTEAGLFDVSHMGEAILEGPDALRELNALLTNRFDSLAVGAARYSVMTNEHGGAVDDLIVYRLAETRWLLILNAANTEKDLVWLQTHLSGDAVLTDVSDRWAQLALQGPNSRPLLSTLCDGDALPGKYYRFVPSVSVAGVDCMVARTGYTGEFGYELLMAPEAAGTVWDALTAAGAKPCGLGARDTLRLEAAMPLYGHELTEDIGPLEAGLDFAVKLDKDFPGRDALVAAGSPARKRVGLRVTGRGILREHQEVYLDGERVGVTTSGTFCPSVGAGCAMAYVAADRAEDGTAVEVDVRGRRIPAQIVPLPFYKREKA